MCRRMRAPSLTCGLWIVPLADHRHGAGHFPAGAAGPVHGQCDQPQRQAGRSRAERRQEVPGSSPSLVVLVSLPRLVRLLTPRAALVLQVDALSEACVTYISGGRKPFSRCRRWTLDFSDRVACVAFAVTPDNACEMFQCAPPDDRAFALRYIEVRILSFCMCFQRALQLTRAVAGCRSTRTLSSSQTASAISQRSASA